MLMYTNCIFISVINQNKKSYIVVEYVKFLSLDDSILQNKYKKHHSNIKHNSNYNIKFSNSIKKM